MTDKDQDIKQDVSQANVKFVQSVPIRTFVEINARCGCKGAGEEWTECEVFSSGNDWIEYECPTCKKHIMIGVEG